jgi:hypothetical protein
MRSNRVVVFAPLLDDDFRFLQAVDRSSPNSGATSLLLGRPMAQFALCDRHLDLTKQSRDLLCAKPLLRHDHFLPKPFSHNAWSKRA